MITHLRGPLSLEIIGASIFGGSVHHFIEICKNNQSYETGAPALVSSVKYGDQGQNIWDVAAQNSQHPNFFGAFYHEMTQLGRIRTP